MFVFVYIAAIVAANLLVASFGPAITPVNAFFLIGLDLAIRDALHVRWQGKDLALRMFLLIAVSGAISYALNPATGMIAVASLVAFSVSGLVDTLVFTRMRDRPFLVRSNVSNLFGALVDSILFPTIAFGALLPHIVAGQFAAKVLGAALWAFLLARTLRK